MANLKENDLSQGMFLTVNLQEQLLPDTFEWTIEYLINKMDTSIFERNYNNDERGAAAYPPKALLKLILFCYSKGIISSRKIEKAAKENITAKALAEDFEPDHDTIATFISTNSEAIKDLFAQVLVQCSQLELITGKMFAIDGCKLPSNASKEWSGSIADLRRKRDRLGNYITQLLHQHQELDRDEKAKKKLKPYQKTMGDDKERRARSIERLENKLEKLNKFLESAEPKIGAAGTEVQSNITDNESARIKGPHGYIQGYNGIAIADSGNQVIIAGKAIGSGAEGGCFPEMLDKLEENMKTLTGKEKPLEKALVEGDTNYFSEDNLREAASRGIDVLIPDSQFRQRDPHFTEIKKAKVKKDRKFTTEDFNYKKANDCFICPAGKALEYKHHVTLRNNSGKKYQAKSSDCIKCPMHDRCTKKRSGKKHARTLYIIDKKHENPFSQVMRKKIDEPINRELYSRRMQIIEPVFSNITHCKGMDRFTLRTQEKVNIQWLLFCIVHNLWKCMKPLGARYRK